VNKEETMKTLRFQIAACLALCLAAPLCAAETASNPGWEKLKTLVGEWDGTEDGKPFHVSYRLVSSGTALMETMTGSDAMEMITVYHPDGGSILMTHYCSMGNQPRMRATKLAGNKLTFHYLDAANVKGADDPRMSGLTLTFTDVDHLGADWTHRMGAREDVGHFAYTRKK
jgi:hypothetical protein